jgi:hypothetical protein
LGVRKFACWGLDLCLKSPIPTPSLLSPAPSPPPSLPSLAPVPGGFAVKKSALAAPAAVAALVVLAVISVGLALALNRQKCPVLKLPAAPPIVAAAAAILAKKRHAVLPVATAVLAEKRHAAPPTATAGAGTAHVPLSSAIQLHTAPHSFMQAPAVLAKKRHDIPPVATAMLAKRRPTAPALTLS